MKSDKVFNKPIKKQFEFDEEVAVVFDDMLSRSVPFYDEAMKLTSHFASINMKEGDKVYDLGCSTASLLLEIERRCEHKIELIGIDNSQAMLEQASKKLHAFNSKIQLHCADILTYNYEEARVICSNYTLQFVRPPVRSSFVKKIYEALKPGGLFIFSEKVISKDPELNKQMIDTYYDYKKAQGYSEYEIVQKREALENVLIPYTEEENLKMLKDAGFSHCDSVFKWVNFETFIAKK
ncbi:carboxy-S-adenosyl-L-methionine synthase CmoA [Sulfurimonas sp. MAG313]|nr:carboxy-S-adenosyl-L-methionine synthase CmoA [Sulfurimonas sp. MAG313]MDF1882243.1 carboxy-S-adenosyl-L-methionine synthase CmoA [Sulfurimonas sp. MAG313]